MHLSGMNRREALGRHLTLNIVPADHSEEGLRQAEPIAA